MRARADCERQVHATKQRLQKATACVLTRLQQREGSDGRRGVMAKAVMVYNITTWFRSSTATGGDTPAEIPING